MAGSTSHGIERACIHNEVCQNYLRHFREENAYRFHRFTATQFMDVWNHYDTDGNGFIEGNELDNFLREFVSSMTGNDNDELLSDSALASVKEAFMDAFDENGDDKIEISELAQILPTEENFLLLFHHSNPLDSSVEFMKTWHEFDKDSSGYIEADELKTFLLHLLREAQQLDHVTEDKLIEYTTTILQIFDRNHDGKLHLSEMAKLIQVKENYLCRPIFNGVNKITEEDIKKVFNLYDKDQNGHIENEELYGFIKDLMELVQEDYDVDDIESMKEAILDKWDMNRDGKISLDELTMVLRKQCSVTIEAK